MVERAREVCGSMRVGVKNPNSVRWKDKIKAAVWRKEDAWKEVLATSDEEAKERCMETYREEKRRERLKGVYIRAKRK